MKPGAGQIDEEGKRTDRAAKAFNLHEDDAFQTEFGKIVKDAYPDLFELHGDGAWTLDSASLISFFRNNDQTTAIVGQRQASTFSLLAAYSGHGDVPDVKQAPKKPQVNSPRRARSKPTTPPPRVEPPAAQGALSMQSGSFGLTVRIEINLPASADQDTYDKIFRSIRENLIHEKGS